MLEVFHESSPASVMDDGQDAVLDEAEQGFPTVDMGLGPTEFSNQAQERKPGPGELLAR